MASGYCVQLHNASESPKFGIQKAQSFKLLSDERMLSVNLRKLHALSGKYIPHAFIFHLYFTVIMSLLQLWLKANIRHIHFYITRVYFSLPARGHLEALFDERPTRLRLTPYRLTWLVFPAEFRRGDAGWRGLGGGLTVLRRPLEVTPGPRQGGHHRLGLVHLQVGRPRSQQASLLLVRSEVCDLVFVKTKFSKCVKRY